MGLIRRELHTKATNRLADQLRAIAHPARLALVRHIAARNDCICTDLSKEVGLAQATVSQHLKVLKEAGIIQGAIEGNAVCYCISPRAIRAFKQDFLEILEELENANCNSTC